MSVRGCAIEITPGMLRFSLMYAFGRAYGLTYKMATFIATKGLFNTVCKEYHLCLPLHSSTLAVVCWQMPLKTTRGPVKSRLARLLVLKTIPI